MDEAEHLADRVAVVVDGRLVAQGSPAETGGGDTGVGADVPAPHATTAADLPDLGGRLVGDGLEWQVATTAPTAALHRLTRWRPTAGSTCRP